jgi:hypothetical protein
VETVGLAVDTDSVEECEVAVAVGLFVVEGVCVVVGRDVVVAAFAVVVEGLEPVTGFTEVDGLELATDFTVEVGFVVSVVGGDVDLVVSVCAEVVGTFTVTTVVVV